MLLLFKLSFKKDFNVWEMIGSVSVSQGVEKELKTGILKEVSYREYTRNKAIEIWKDHVIWGAGPSMYGGALSVKYNSPYYEYRVYKILPLVVDYLRSWGTIDQFWPQVLAELGIIGVILFSCFFILLTIMLYLFRRNASSTGMKNLFTGFMVYILVILIYTIVLTLNLTPIIFSFFAFIGIASGYIIRLSDS